jgi:hypothetical protein
MSFRDKPPTDTTITDYDRQCFTLYLQLLDANSAGADWREAYRTAFEQDPDEEPERAFAQYQAHLVRATWMCEEGYRDLLNSPA